MKNITKSWAARGIACLLATSLAVMGCTASNDTEPEERGHHVTLSFEAGGQYAFIDVTLAEGGDVYEGTITVTNADGESRVRPVSYPAQENEQGTFKVETDEEGQKWINAEGQRMKVTAYSETERGLTLTYIGVNGELFHYTQEGDSPFIVCAGACITAIILAGTCAAATLTSLWLCWWSDGDWTYSIGELCSGSCVHPPES